MQVVLSDHGVEVEKLKAEIEALKNDLKEQLKKGARMSLAQGKLDLGKRVTVK